MNGMGVAAAGSVRASAGGVEGDAENQDEESDGGDAE
jgi:hypothetical protein